MSRSRVKTSAIAPYLMGAYIVAERVPPTREFPFTLSFVKELDMDLGATLTLFTGENGSGKSTLLGALADLAGLPVTGGSRNELPESAGKISELARAMRPKFRMRPPDSFFFRADTLVDFARILDHREEDPDFCADPYEAYGGRSLQTRSHGEGVRNVLSSRTRGGLFLFDEPEAALSPTRQLEFAEHLESCCATGAYQFIIATHSPILMSIKGARILDFDDPALPVIDRTATRHWMVYRKVLCGE